jgi:hypothetical protein
MLTEQVHKNLVVDYFADFAMRFHPFSSSA